MEQAQRELRDSSPPGPMVLTLGVFDGVHLGHRHLLAEVVRLARERGCLSGAVTFHPHPSVVLRPDQDLSYVTSLEDRTALIADAGIELVVPLTFTPGLSQLGAREFVGLLVDSLKMRGMVVGPDFALGRGREGTLDVLRQLGAEMGFTVEVVRPVAQNGEVVSSTAVRRALAEGDVEKVGRLLGRPYSIRGLVMRGVERGRTIGFPTANLGLEPDRALPKNGVYAGRARLGGEVYQAVANIGVRPTFGGRQRLVEVHMLDFDRDIYGRHLTVELVRRLRDERRFAGVAELKAQIARDVERVRAVAKRAPHQEPPGDSEQSSQPAAGKAAGSE